MTVPPAQSQRLGPATTVGWALAIVPFLLLGVVLAYIVVTGGGLTELAGPPVEQVSITRIALPQQGIMQVEVINDGPQEVTIPQILVDDAYWGFTADPSTTIPRFGRATYTVPYPWVEGETHSVVLITSLGMTFSAQVNAAVESPSPSPRLFAQFGLVGLYVGVVPVALGMLWFPFLRRLGARGLMFVLALTVGLLMYLAVATWQDASELALALPAFWQGIPLVLFVASATLFVLVVTSGGHRGRETTPLEVSYRIAFGIGLHNLGEGLAIGAAFALGQAALGTFLILGFTLHNITEGVGIVSPLIGNRPRFRHFLFLALVAGGPAILGTWVGGFAFDPVLASIFLAVGLGAILQVIWEVGKLLARDSAKVKMPVTNWVNLGGAVVGIALMYFTEFLVKF